MRTKILIAIVILFCIAITSNAQINKGAILLGGGVGYYSTKSFQPYYNNNTEAKYVNANIQLGKAVNRNSVAGLISSYSYNKMNTNNYPDSNASKNSQFGIGIFYRKYNRLFKDFYFFGEVDAEYTHSQNSQNYSQNGNDGYNAISNGGLISFVPGLSYQLCKRMQVELTMQNIISASFQHYNTNYYYGTPQQGPNKGNTFSFNANLNSNLLSNFGIGFKFLLGKQG